MHRSRCTTPWLFAELGATSLEAIARQMLLMGTGNCAHADYRKMAAEVQASWIEIAFSPWTVWTSMLMPYDETTHRTARRLRKGR